MNELLHYFQQHGKTDSWLTLANKFNILPMATNKQKSDKVRRLFNRGTRTQPYSITTTSHNGPTMWTSAPPLSPVVTVTSRAVDSEYREFLEFKKSKQKAKVLEPFLGGNPDNVLCIGDIHEPFCKEGYLEFCRNQQERFNCGTVIFIGDVIDSHFSSYFASNPDGLSAGMELDQAVTKLQRWYHTFPQASVTLGNHDRIWGRKLYSSGLSERVMKPFAEIVHTPNWKYVEQVLHNDILYVHGEGGSAVKKAQQEFRSVVSGHLHTEGYVQLLNGGKNFGMQVGCGIDFESYAFAYAQRGKQPILSCGIVLGSAPILVPFNEN